MPDTPPSPRSEPSQRQEMQVDDVATGKVSRMCGFVGVRRRAAWSPGFMALLRLWEASFFGVDFWCRLPVLRVLLVTHRCLC